MARRNYAAYVTRDRLLRAMGYDSYAEYLASDWWRFIRGRAMKKHGGLCRMCYREATELHHASYALDVLRGKDLDKLIPLCRACHNIAEFTTTGQKRTLAEANTLIEKYHERRPQKAERVTQPAAKRKSYRCRDCRIMSRRKKYCIVCFKKHKAAKRTTSAA